jgi:uncharacterized membrane protein YqjE
MDPINGSSPGTSHSKTLARLMLAIGENRLELLKVETGEERERFLRSILLAFGAAAFILLAGMTLSAAIVVCFWSSSPVAVLLTLTGFYGVAGGWFYLRILRLLRNQKTFAASFDQLEGDACLFGKEFRRDPSEPRKHLLIAESERNRIQLAREMEALRAEVSTLTDRAKSISSIASSAVELTSGLAAFRRNKSDGNGAKLPWLPVMLKGAGLISALWVAVRQRGHHHHIPVSATTNPTSRE